MKKHHRIWPVAVSSIVIFCCACSDKPAPVPGALQKEIALGEKIFAEKECGKCHTNSESTVPPKMKAPDLTSVSWITDTTLVKGHLQFTEMSAMPPLDLTHHETNALAKYVAHLHARAKTDPNLKNPDGVCPVCGAPLKISKAQADGLQATHDGKTFYFDCADCKRLYERDASWYGQHGYLAMP